MATSKKAKLNKSHGQTKIDKNKVKACHRNIAEIFDNDTAFILDYRSASIITRHLIILVLTR